MNLTINGESRYFSGPITLSALIDQMGMKHDRVAVELNRNIMQRDVWPGTTLNDGDNLEIVHFVGGGATGNIYPDRKAFRKGEPDLAKERCLP